MLKIKEVANLVGISVRTLHHYDQIDLFKPSNVSEAGYRLYSEEDLVELQQLLFFKELGFTLKEIKKIMKSPNYSQKEALVFQKKMLLEKRQQVDQMLKTVDRTIQELEGEIIMTQEEHFFGLTSELSQYEEEAKQRWGEKEVSEKNTKLKKMNLSQKNNLASNWDQIFNKLGELRLKKADDIEVQIVIKEWYLFLNDNFGNYTVEAFQGLGQLYVSDERFTQNINQYGEGVALLMSEAMTVFAENNG